MKYGDLAEITLPTGDIVRGVKINNQNPPKTAIVGLPTNEQIVRKMDTQKSVRKNLGRRKSTTDYVPNTKGDLQLFNEIRLDKGEEFDEFEASSAIGKLTYVEVVSCERSGDQFVVELKTPFGVSIHTLNMPIQRDLQQYRRSVVSSMDLPHGVEELRYRIGPPCALYDTVVAKIEGYNDTFTTANVPPHHKSAAVAELVQAMDDLDPVIDPNS